MNTRIAWMLATVWALVAALPADSAIIIWTNTLGGNWSVVSNWNPHQTPTNTDTVYITNSGTYTVNLDSAVNVDAVTFLPIVTLGAGGGAAGTQTFLITNQNFSYTNFLVTTGGVVHAVSSDIGNYGSTTSILTVSGGILDATNCSFSSPIVATNTGTLNTSNNTYEAVTVGNAVFNSSHDSLGSLEYAFPSTQISVANKGVINSFDLSVIGQMTVSAGGVFNVQGVNPAEVILNGPLTNSGAIYITNTEFLVGYGSGVGGIWNEPGGAIYLNGTVSFNGGIGDDYVGMTFLTNRGAITEQTGPGTSASLAFVDNTSGTITNLSGTLLLGAITNLSGAFNTAAGAIIQLSAGSEPVTPSPSITIAGSGQTELVSGELYLASNNIPNLYFDGALGSTLQLGPSFQGGAITNLQVDGVIMTNTLSVKGIFAITNSDLYGNFTIGSGGSMTTSNVFLYNGITVASGGALAMENGGSFSNVTVAAGGMLTLIGQSTGFGGGVRLTTTLVNSGTVNVSNCLLQINLATNQPGGIINFLGSGSSINPGTSLINLGAIIQNAAAAGGTNNINVTTFDTSHGDVTNFGGTLVLQALPTNIGGTLIAEPGAAIDLSGGTAANPLVVGSPAIAGGTVQFTGGWLSFPTNNFSGLQLIAGTLLLGPNFQGGVITNLTILGITLTNTLPVKGTFIASNSPLYGSFTIQNGGTFYDGTETSGALNVASGATMWLYGAMEIGPGGSLNIASGGTFNVVSTSVSPGPYLLGPLTNSGTINLTNGPLFFTGIGMANDGVNYFGTLVNQSSGTINFGSDSTEIVSFPTAALVNNGAIIKTGGTGDSTLEVTPFTSTGTIAAESGTLEIVYPATLTSASTLKVGLNSASNYGQIAFETNATVAGTFIATLNNGYLPVNGAAFNPVYSSSSLAGTFGTVTLPSGITWQKTYTATNLELTVTSSRLGFSSFARSGTNLIFMGSGGTQGSNYVILTSTNLGTAVANWTPLFTNTFGSGGNFDYTNPISTAKPRQFYIIRSP